MRAAGCLVLISCAAAPAPVVATPVPSDASVAFVCPDSNVPDDLMDNDLSKMSIGHPPSPHVRTDVVERSPSINSNVLDCDLANRSARLLHCYFGQVRRSASVVTIKFRIAEDGSTTALTTPSTTLEECFTQVILLSAFGKPPIAGEVTLSLTLDPGT